jgi:uncharacterized membrane protein
MVIDPFGTITVVLLKGILAGLAAGFVYKLLSKKDKTIAAITAAIVCPLVNTGVFILGSYVFFIPTLTQWGAAAGYSSVTAFIFLAMVGLNFLVELAINFVLSPTIVRLIQYKNSEKGE